MSGSFCPLSTKFAIGMPNVSLVEMNVIMDLSSSMEAKELARNNFDNSLVFKAIKIAKDFLIFLGCGDNYIACYSHVAIPR
jgi:hypothetical protein